MSAAIFHPEAGSISASCAQNHVSFVSQAFALRGVSVVRGLFSGVFSGFSFRALWNQLGPKKAPASAVMPHSTPVTSLTGQSPRALISVQDQMQEIEINLIKAFNKLCNAFPKLRDPEFLVTDSSVPLKASGLLSKGFSYLGYEDERIVFESSDYPHLIFKIRPETPGWQYRNVAEYVEIALICRAQNIVHSVVIDNISLVRISGLAPFLYYRDRVLIQQKVSYAHTLPSGARQTLNERLAKRGIQIITANSHSLDYGMVGGHVVRCNFQGLTLSSTKLAAMLELRPVTEKVPSPGIAKWERVLNRKSPAIPAERLIAYAIYAGRIKAGLSPADAINTVLEFLKSSMAKQKVKMLSRSNSFTDGLPRVVEAPAGLLDLLYSVEIQMSRAIELYNKIKLEKRAQEVMNAVAAGWKNKRIAEHLKIKESTVLSYLHIIKRQLQIEGHVTRVIIARVAWGSSNERVPVLERTKGGLEEKFLGLLRFRLSKNLIIGIPELMALGIPLEKIASVTGFPIKVICCSLRDVYLALPCDKSYAQFEIAALYHRNSWLRTNWRASA